MCRRFNSVPSHCRRTLIFPQRSRAFCSPLALFLPWMDFPDPSHINLCRLVYSLLLLNFSYSSLTRQGYTLRQGSGRALRHAQDKQVPAGPLTFAVPPPTAGPHKSGGLTSGKGRMWRFTERSVLRDSWAQMRPIERSLF